MMIQLCDRTVIDDAAKMRITPDGYLVANPLVARTGIQLYYGRELGMTGNDAGRVIKVYRPETEVFSTDSMKTYAHKPVTDDHPSEAVNADNWARLGKGQIGDEVARDGQAIRVPLVLMDGGLVKKVQEGKAELSMGYGCDIEWGAGQTADGQSYDCSQKNIRINHIAVVDAARAGKEFRIGDGSGAAVDFKVYADALTAIVKGNINKSLALADADGHLAKDSKGTLAYPIMKDGRVFLDSLRAAKTDAVAKGDGDALAALDNLLSRVESGASTHQPTQDGRPNKETTRMKVMQIDGVSVEVGDGNAQQIIDKHISGLTSTVADLTSKITAQASQHDAAVKLSNDQIAKLTTDLATATAQAATLTSQLKDAEMTPAKLDSLVADRQIVAAKAKAVLPSVVCDGKTDGDIRRQVVDAKLGAVAAGWTDDQVRTSFDTLTATIDGKSVVQDASFNAAHHRPGGFQDTARIFADGGGSQRQTADAAADKRDRRLQDAWKHPNGAAPSA